jgi:YD repeat-containing protein
MRKTLLLAVVALMAASCDNEESTPAPQIPELVPLKMEQLDGTRELIYDASGKITGLSIVTNFVNGSKMTSVQTLTYNAAGQLTESTTDTGWRMVYTYNDKNQIVKTDEYVNGTWSQLHEYTYNDKGLLIQSIKSQNIPEEGGLIPVAKDEYIYDQNGNVILQFLYYYTSFGIEAKMLTKFTFGDYDGKINTEEYFDMHPFNPFIKLRKNNPGKMIVQNANGIISSTEIYQYKYNTEGYATEKTSFTTMHNGNTGSYVTTYTFKN